VQGFGDICSVFLLQFGAEGAAPFVDWLASVALRHVQRASPLPPALVCPPRSPRGRAAPRSVYSLLPRDTMQPTFDRVEAKLAFMWPLLRLWDRPVCDALQRCALVRATDG